MAGTLATIEVVGNSQVWSGGAGQNANDVCIQTGDISKFDDFQLMSTAGAMQVLASIDGTNYVTAPLSLIDEGATSAAGVVLVIVTAPNRLYRLQGTFAAIKVTQNGATGVANASMNATKKGGQY